MRRWLKYLFEIFLMFALFIICDTPGTKKYLAILLLTFVVFLIGRKKNWMPETVVIGFLPIITYLCMGIAGNLLTGSFYGNTLKIMMLWVIPAVFAFAMCVYYGMEMSRIVDFQFFACSTVFFVKNAYFIYWFYRAESMFAYAFGAFFIYYFYKKKWSFCVISSVLLFLVDKRIVLLAVIAALMVMGVMSLFQKDRRLGMFLWGCIIIFIYGYLWFICSGTFEYLCKGIGIDTSGRVKIYDRMIHSFEQSVLFWGRGVGIVEELLNAWNIKKYANLHNDLLKFYIELGLIGLLLFLIAVAVVLWLIAKKYGSVKMCAVLGMIVYTMVLFATDNVSIYVIYLIPFYSILYAIILGNEQKKISKIGIKGGKWLKN